MREHPQFIYFLTFLILLILTIILDRQYGMLRDTSTAKIKPYSWSRVQLAWWTVIILSGFFAIMITKNVVPTFSASTLILLGISVGTLATGTMIDTSDSSDPAVTRNQDKPDAAQNFFLDILSDGTGVTIHRFQTVLFNFAFGIWVFSAIMNNLSNDVTPAIHSIASLAGLAAYANDIAHAKATIPNPYNYIIPDITQNNLILLGLSSATYAALKVGENKNTSPSSQSDDTDSTPSGNNAAASTSGSNAQPAALPAVASTVPASQPDASATSDAGTQANGEAAAPRNPDMF